MKLEKIIEKRFGNYNIEKRLSFSFGSVITLLLIITLISICGIFKVSSSLTSFYKNPYQMTKEAHNSQLALESIYKNIYLSATAESEEEVKATLEKVAASAAVLDENWALISKHFDGDPALIDNFQAALDAAQPIRKEIMKMAAAQDPNVIQKVHRSYSPYVNNELKYLDQITNYCYQRASYYNSQGSIIKVVVLVFIVFLAALSLVFSLYLRKSIMKSILSPVAEIQSAANQMAAGNLNTKISYHKNDELGLLSEDLRGTIHSLREYIENISAVVSRLADKDMTARIEIGYKGDFSSIKASINQIAEALDSTLSLIHSSSLQVREGSEQLSMISHIISQGAGEQKHSVDTLLHTVNGLTQKVEANTRNAERADLLSSETLGNIDSGNQQMKTLLKSMDKISAQSHEISNITEVINSIAKQTNLLSLNASIEAARAGEQGKGFAVVANQIGILANESAAASKNIVALINESIRVVEEGVQLALQTAGVLNGTVTSFEQTGLLVNKITQASRLQSQSLKQMVSEVHSISDVIDCNSAVSEEASTASNELLAKIQEVVDMLEQFKTGEDTE